MAFAAWMGGSCSPGRFGCALGSAVRGAVTLAAGRERVRIVNLPSVKVVTIGSSS
jgi:hypothetical protein